MVNIFGESVDGEEITIISERDAKQICTEQDEIEQDKYGVIMLREADHDPIPFKNSYIKGFLFPFTTK